jgi:hypothetical protein
MNSAQVYIHSQLIVIRKNPINRIVEGIQIKTQHFNKEVCVGGCKEFIYYESQLDLIDVTLNSFTVYQCTANIDQQIVSKTISFSIKGIIGISRKWNTCN